MSKDAQSGECNNRLVNDRVELTYRYHLNFTIMNLMIASFIYGVYDDYMDKVSMYIWMASLLAVVFLEMGLYVTYLFYRQRLNAKLWERAHFVMSLLGCVVVGGGIWWVQGASMFQAQWPVTIIILVYAVIVYGMLLLNVSLLAMCMLALLSPAIVYYMTDKTTDGYLYVLALVVVGLMLVSCAVPSSKFFKSASLNHYRIEILSNRLATEKENTEAALAIAQQADASKTAFFAAANHDLQQPLHAISLLIESLKLDLDAINQENDVFVQLEGNVRILNQMFNHYLDVSRIKTGQLHVNMQTFAVQDVFDDIMALYSLRAAEKGLQLRMSLTNVMVHSDQAIVTQILGNLVSNAISYTEIGTVWIGYRRSRQVIEVRDSGIGIAEEQHEPIFSDYYQVHHDLTIRPYNHGIGLAVASRLAKVLRAPLSLRSKLGCGSVFRIQLRIADDAQTIRNCEDADSK